MTLTTTCSSFELQGHNVQLNGISRPPSSTTNQTIAKSSFNDDLVAYIEYILWFGCKLRHTLLPENMDNNFTNKSHDSQSVSHKSDFISKTLFEVIKWNPTNNRWWNKSNCVRKKFHFTASLISCICIIVCICICFTLINAYLCSL